MAVSRVNQYGTLSVNDGVPVKGHTEGDLNELNLPMMAYLGGCPTEVWHGPTTFKPGLHGAIQRVGFNTEGRLQYRG